MPHLKYYYGNTSHVHTSAKINTCTQRCLHIVASCSFTRIVAHTDTFTTDCFICGYHEYKICRKQHLGKSCNGKWRELTGTSELILPEINETTIT